MDIFVPTAPRGMRRTSAGLLVPDGERPRAPHARGVIQTRSLYSRGVAGGGGGGGGRGTATPLAPFFNSHEVRDSNTLLTDDFSRQSWYLRDADHWGGACASVDPAEWSGTIFWDKIDACGCPPNGAAVEECNFGWSPWCAEHQDKSGQGGSTLADHNLVNGPNSETEVWLRWYQRWHTGYQFGAEKVFVINRSRSDGIYFGNIHINLGAGSLSSSGQVYWQNPGASTSVNSGFAVSGNNHWYCIQVRVLLNSPGSNNGTIAIYIDDCGTDGVSHPASPTLRASNTSYQFQRDTTADKIGNVWKENWSNPGSSGRSTWAYPYASRVGPIPFAA